MPALPAATSVFGLRQAYSPVSKEYLDGVNLTNEVFYDYLKHSKVFPKTSLPQLDVLEDEINNLNIGLVCACSINPIDEKFIRSLEDGAILYVYEDVIYSGSLGCRILQFVNQYDINVKVYAHAVREMLT